MNPNSTATATAMAPTWMTLPDDVRLRIVSMLTLHDAYNACQAFPDQVQSEAFRIRIKKLRPLRDAWVHANESALPNYANPPALATRAARLAVTPLHFSKLKTLPLRNSNLQTLPSSIGELTELRTLDASYNYISHLPSALAACTRLRVIDLAFNELDHVPAVLFHLPSLCTLLLSNNPIASLPSDHWGRLHFLYRLGLYHCNLSAPLPVQLCNWLVTPTEHNRHRSANLQQNNFHGAYINHLFESFPKLQDSILI